MESAAGLLETERQAHKLNRLSGTPSAIAALHPTGRLRLSGLLRCGPDERPASIAKFRLVRALVGPLLHNSLLRFPLDASQPAFEPLRQRRIVGSDQEAARRYGRQHLRGTHYFFIQNHRYLLAEVLLRESL